jgi:acetyltransferase-like isoleucine patch superfamily enzyme
MSALATIVLFVYNRPQHTLNTLLALQKNNLAKESVLYVYADGAKNDATEIELNKIKETRALISKEQWCKEVNIIEASINQGLADSIINGVTAIVNKYGKAIILEDDIVISNTFLDFMNNALNFYENEHDIMHISGYVDDGLKEQPQGDFYTNQFTHCWGWATWKRAWRFFEPDVSILYKLISRNTNKLNFKSDLYTQLEQNYNKQLKTWAVKWYASVFLQNGKCLHPSKSLIINTGFDGSGTNCSAILTKENEDLNQSQVFNFTKNIEHLKFTKPRTLVEKISNRINIKFDKPIFMGSSKNISKTAIIEHKFGGQIYIGINTEILEGVIIQTFGGLVQIGNNCSINPYTIIYGHGGVKIGNNVLIAAHCVVIPANHQYNSKLIPINQQGEIRKGIIIEDDVWLGAGVKVLDGVTIGKGAIVAAGAIVNKNVDPFTIVGGVPAQKIKTRDSA